MFQKQESLTLIIYFASQILKCRSKGRFKHCQPHLKRHFLAKFAYKVSYSKYHNLKFIIFLSVAI